jgi:radical SAM protein with 4Fe4S-binding SPASM domain
MSLLDYIKAIGSYGYNIINGMVYDYFPTEKDDIQITSHIERIRYCKQNVQWYQHKIFRYHPSIDFYTHCAHKCLRHTPRISPVSFIYKHYSWTSFEHGVNKLFKDRKSRYVERIDDPFSHYQHLDILPIQKDLVRDSRGLMIFDDDKFLLSPQKFMLIMQFRHIWKSFLYLRCVWYGRYVKRALLYIVYVWNILFKINPQKSIKILLAEIKKTFTSAKMKTVESTTRTSTVVNFVRHIAAKIQSHNDILKQKTIAFGYPETYHFLMVNHCNAKCKFCNQEFNGQPFKEITLDTFKKMVSHIQMESAKVFYFSGGGEPLLCRDLFPILNYLSKTFPWVDIHIRTNGLLIQKYAEELVKSNIAQLEISVHGTSEINNVVIQKKISEDIYNGIALLNIYLKQLNKKIYKMFCPVVSQDNINNLPELIRKAAELEVDEIDLFFCRYYSHDGVNNSLYFKKEMYNSAIKNASRIAKSLGISFVHEPLFNQKFKEKPCLLPWTQLVIDWDGDIYPCTGGEVWFKDKVKSASYNFGNLLREHLYQCWNNNTYIMLRRTVNLCHKQYFIPECENCHNTICLKGADVKNGHILKQI